MKERASCIPAGFVLYDQVPAPIQRTWTRCLVCVALLLAACGVDQPSQEAGDLPVPTTGENQIEPDVDGSVQLADGPAALEVTAPTASDGEACLSDSDCASDSCVAGVCTHVPSCTDGVKNGDETDVDCGGSCASCVNGSACLKKSDCASGGCTRGRCLQVPMCTDSVKNGNESDVDCGGSCAHCVDGKACLFNSDCASNSCVAQVCTLVASCTDRVKNGSETDVDCGGSCANCVTGKECRNAADCASGGCIRGRCLQVPLCMDSRKDGDETDVDCGGSCEHCADGKACLSSSDCASGDCAAGLCAQPTAALAATACTDDVKNGDETDVDCGGRCPVCLDWKHCLSAIDCVSGGCDQGFCTPAGL